MKQHLVLVAPLLLAFCAPAVEPHRPSASPPALRTGWRERVAEARALEDLTQKKEAMLLLVREALNPREVKLSGELHPEQVHPVDNLPAPVVNFDLRLNQKSSAQPRSGAATRSLENNFGYYFSHQGVGYVVLGPAALDPRSPLLTRMAAEHELFHAEHHVGDPRPSPDRELEAWTSIFVRFFHDVHQFRQQWRPMLNYYDDASEVEKTAAVQRLISFYRNAPTPAGGTAAEVRAAFEQWLARSKGAMPSAQFVIDLERAMAGLPAGS